MTVARFFATARDNLPRWWPRVVAVQLSDIHDVTCGHHTTLKTPPCAPVCVCPINRVDVGLSGLFVGIALSVASRDLAHHVVVSTNKTSFCEVVTYSQ
jgi:hypothetical protein